KWHGRPARLLRSRNTGALTPSALNTLQLPRAVSNALRRDAHAVKHREVKIGHRRFLVELDVASGRKRAAALTGQQDRQVVVVVPVAVPDGAAINNHAIVEQRPFAFLD